MPPPGGHCAPGGASSNASAQPCGPPPCEPGKECAPPPGGPCGPAPGGKANGTASGPGAPGSQPCGPPPPHCTPEKPCAPPKPAFCDENADGSMTCRPPPGCEGKMGQGACVPPPFCKQSGEAFTCTPPAPGSAEAAQACPPGVQPCGPPPPPCAPGPDGALVCAPPPECGGAAFGGAGIQGCAPPEFCKADADGKYLCKPPEDCRKGPDGRERCIGPATGASCAKQLQGVAAEGAFVPCAPPPQHFCPPPPPGAPPTKDTCRAPPPPPRFCAPGEAQFKPNHPPGAPADCMPPPRVENGVYLPPGQAMKAGECQVPPPGQWPPPFAPEQGKVWCPPPGFAPPPAEGQGFEAWRRFAEERAPPQVMAFVNHMGERWSHINGTALEGIHKEGSVHQMFAPSTFDGRAINGTFLQSTLDENMRIRNFSVGGTPFFREARPNVQANASFSTVAGPAVVAAGGAVVVETHNVPAGILAYRSAGNDSYSVDLTPEDGYQIAKEGGVVVLRKGDWKGVLVGDAEVGPGGAIKVDVDPARPAFFMAVPPSGLEAETRVDIAKGVQQGKVFAEVSLVQRNDTLAQDLTMYAHDEAFRVDVLNATEDVVEVFVSGEGQGQALVLTVDRSTLATPLSEMNVTMDGVLMRECATFDEMAGSASTGGCYTLAANESVVRVSVMPEHFSDHVIALGSVGATPEEATSEETPTETDTDGDADADGRPADEGAKAPAPATPTGDAPAAEKDAKTPGVGFFGTLAALAGAGAVLARRRRS